MLALHYKHYTHVRTHVSAQKQRQRAAYVSLRCTHAPQVKRSGELAAYDQIIGTTSICERQPRRNTDSILLHTPHNPKRGESRRGIQLKRVNSPSSWPTISLSWSVVAIGHAFKSPESENIHTRPKLLVNEYSELWSYYNRRGTE